MPSGPWALQWINRNSSRFEPDGASGPGRAEATGKEWPKSERPRLPADDSVVGERLLNQEPVAEFLTQFRAWCFSGELTQLAYQIPTIPLPT
jgi:hypothetical protein